MSAHEDRAHVGLVVVVTAAPVVWAVIGAVVWGWAR